MYLMTKCGNSGIKSVHNYTNKGSVITRGRQSVTSESTPILTFDPMSPSCNNLWVFKWDIVVPLFWKIDFQRVKSGFIFLKKIKLICHSVCNKKEMGFTMI